jgi:hypothetical protein
VIFFILNNHTAQDVILEYINFNYLKKYDLELGLKAFSLNFLNGTAILKDLSIKERNQKKFHLKIKESVVSFNIIDSYVTRRPQINEISLTQGDLFIAYHKNGNLEIPKAYELLQTSSEKTSETNTTIFLKKIIENIKFNIEIKDFLFHFGNESKTNFQKITLAHFQVEKTKNEKDLDMIQSNIVLGESVFSFPGYSQNIVIHRLETRYFLTEESSFIVKNFDLKSNIANLKLNGKGFFEKNIKNSFYLININQLEIHGNTFFNLLDMKSNGTAIISGILFSGKNTLFQPLFKGKLTWKNLFLEDFNIYSGQADFIFKDKTIKYSNAVIKTPERAVIRSNGLFQLFKNFYFENKAEIENLSFHELMHGLKVPYSPLNFLLNSKKMNIYGYIISLDKKKNFEIFAQGDGEGKKLALTELQHEKSRPPLPNFQFNLNLSAHAMKINLQKSIFFFTKQKKGDMGSLSVDKGNIHLSNPKGTEVDCNITAKKINISAAEYFLKFQTSGIANLQASITLAPGSKNVLFSSKAHVQNGEIFGIKFSEFDGKWGIQGENTWIKNAFFMMQNKERTENTKVNLENFTLNYNTLITKMSLSIKDSQSKLSNVLNSLSYWIPENLNLHSGNIEVLKLDLKGHLFNPSTWTFKSELKILKIFVLGGSINKIKIYLDCIDGVCRKSNLSFLGILTNKNFSSQNEAQSFAIFDLNHFSKQNSKLRVKIKTFPLDFFSPLTSKKLSGYLNSEIQLSGTWQNILGFANFYGSDIIYDKIKVGDSSLEIKPSDEKNISVTLKAFDKKLKLIYFFQKKFIGDSSLNINFKDFDPMNFLTDDMESQNIFFSKFNAKFKFNGPFLFPFIKNKNWYTFWKGNGIFESGALQIGNVFLDMSKEKKMDFDGQKLRIENISFKNQFNEIEIGPTILDLFEKRVSTNFLVYSDLKNIDQVSHLFGRSDGQLKGKFYLSGAWKAPEIFGTLSLSAKTLLLKNYLPAFQNIRIDTKFKNKSLEIEYFHGTKGLGTLSGVGRINFAPLFLKESQFPEVTLKFSAKNLDLRVQIPIFQFADTNFDADVSIAGNELPYHISGNVNLKKFLILKDLNCNQIASALLTYQQENSQSKITQYSLANLNILLQATNSITIQTQCLRGKFSTTPRLNITGALFEPHLSGDLSAESGNLFLLKSQFDIKRADFNFIEAQTEDPNINIKMISRISSYTISADLNGKISQARLDLNIQPSTLSNGDRITQADIISIISTGQIPTQSSSANLLSASSSVFSLLGGNNIADLRFLDQTLSTVTGGIVDNVSFVPVSQNGQFSWRATISRALSERFSLGVSYQNGSGELTARQSAYANFIFNDTVSMFGSFSNANTSVSQQQSSYELFGGLRFNFGSR